MKIDFKDDSGWRLLKPEEVRPIMVADAIINSNIFSVDDLQAISEYLAVHVRYKNAMAKQNELFRKSLGE